MQNKFSASNYVALEDKRQNRDLAAVFPISSMERSVGNKRKGQEEALAIVRGFMRRYYRKTRLHKLPNRSTEKLCKLIYITDEIKKGNKFGMDMHLRQKKLDDPRRYQNECFPEDGNADGQDIAVRSTEEALKQRELN